MRDWRCRCLLGLSMAAVLAIVKIATGDAAPALPPVIDFNRDIRPILAENCYQCHGPDKNKRKARLRLDTREGLFSGHGAEKIVVPGGLERSELYQRIITPDRDQRMPDPKSGKSLSQLQIAQIKKWIEQGAPWQGHWAYLNVVRPPVPAIEDGAFVKNPIDRFVLAKLKAADLRPSPAADRVTLIRRLSFDLTGLPPTRAEVDAFVTDSRPDAYEKLVDHLLASPHYGERMAMYWLDLVRYADSIGYHSDNPMDVAPYRDYVIQAFNANKPFDQFTIEQLAGDLLPQATTQQKVASTYNRLLQTTEEGGAQAKEYEAKYAADRVRNVSSVWLGATMGCCQCHDHKFDPYSTRDFYSMAAFFADVREAAVGRREPGMPVPTEQQAAELKRFEERITAIKQRLDAPLPQLAAAQLEWEKSQATDAQWQVLKPQSMKAAAGTTLTMQLDGVVAAGGTIPAKETYTVTAQADVKGLTGVRLEVLTDARLAAQGPGTSANGNFVLTEFKVAAASGTQPARPIVLSHASADFSQDNFGVAGAIDGKNETGWAISPQVGKMHTAIFELAAPLEAGSGATLTFTLEQQSVYAQHNIGKFRISITTSSHPAGSKALPTEVRSILALGPGRRTEKQQKELAAYYRTIAPLLQPIRAELAGEEKQKSRLIDAIPKSLVTVAGPPRVVRILPRGNWQDESGPIVNPAVPSFLPPMRAAQAQATRLDLARWIVARDNPLAARAYVNRLWKLFFGQGIARPLDDLGSQGEWPTHPELLDWLAVEFMESGWDVKHMVKLLVMSGAYVQSSQVRPELKERDPYNRLIARQARFRLDAEMVRDNALAISGLLCRKIGGPSVKPYQPAGYWAALNFPPREWQNDQGESLYRRGLYTHWQRSFLHPSLQAFDAPSREECTCERARSNIPQQALALLNDPTYVEAARVFAEGILKEGGASVGDRLAWAYGCALSRPPRAEEVKVLTDLYARHRKQYGDDRAAAEKLLSVGAHPLARDKDLPELAAWTSVARVILNLHETITRD